MKVLKDSWEDSGCPKIGEVLREDVSTRGVKQGTLRLRCFFQLLIDAILRAVETMMEEELGPMRNRPYTSMQTTAALVVVTPTSFRSTSTNAWELRSGGLEVNLARQMTFTRISMVWSYHWCVQRRLSGEPVDLIGQDNGTGGGEVCGL
jgi:hypothetical protein